MAESQVCPLRSVVLLLLRTLGILVSLTEGATSAHAGACSVQRTGGPPLQPVELLLPHVLSVEVELLSRALRQLQVNMVNGT